MALKAEWIRKGSGVPMQGLLDEGRQLKPLFQEFGPQLTEFGFTAEDLAEADGLIVELDTDKSRVIEARSQSKGNTRNEGAARVEGKRVKRILLSAAEEARARDLISDEDYEALLAGKKLGDSTPRISEYLGKIHETVKRLEPTLQRFTGKEQPVAMLEKAKAQLDGAQTTQEFNIQALPAETQAVYEKKGRLLSIIESFIRTGKRAFDGNALVIGRFNKDLILRAVQERKAEEVEEPK